MKKSLLFLLSLTLLVSCSKDSGKSDSTLKITKPVNEAPGDHPIVNPEIPDEYSHLIGTNLIKKEMYHCLLDPKNPPVQIELDKNAIKGIAHKNFELVLNESFAKKVITDIVKKARGEKISPDFFWTKLDTNLATTLNNYLANRYIKLSAQKFDELRRLIAYGMIFFMEKQDYSVGYFIQYNTNQSLKIAFSKVAFTAEMIQVCSMQDLKDFIVIPSNLLSPVKIDGVIACTHNKKKVNLTVTNKDWLKIEFPSSKKIFNVHLSKSKLKIRNDEVEIRAEGTKGSGLDIELTLKKKVKTKTRRGALGRFFRRDYIYTYFDDEYVELDIDIDSKSFRFDESDLKCETKKAFDFKTEDK